MGGKNTWRRESASRSHPCICLPIGLPNKMDQDKNALVHPNDSFQDMRHSAAFFFLPPTRIAVMFLLSLSVVIVTLTPFSPILVKVSLLSPSEMASASPFLP